MSLPKVFHILYKPVSTFLPSARLSGVKQSIDTFRTFTRFYTSIITFIEKGIGPINYSFPEMRVLCKLYELGECSAKKILHTVKIDKGHLSRVLNRLESIGVINMYRLPADRRLLMVNLTEKGTKEAEEITGLFDKQFKKILTNMIPEKQQQLSGAMTIVMQLLDESHNPARMKFKAKEKIS